MGYGNQGRPPKERQCPYLLVWDDGRSVGVVGKEQLPHAKGILEGPLVVLGGPAVELTHQAQGLVRGG